MDAYTPHHSLPKNHDRLVYHTLLSYGKVNADALRIQPYIRNLGASEHFTNGGGNTGVSVTFFLDKFLSKWVTDTVYGPVAAVYTTAVGTQRCQAPVLRSVGDYGGEGAGHLFIS
jgi:hypothetical protein